MRKRTAIAAIVVATIAWVWHRDDATPKPVGAPQSETERPGIGELIAKMPTPAQLKLRPLYVFEGSLRLEGQTVDGDKQPVGGVKVTLNAKRSVISEADGSFAFDHLAAADYAITAEKALAYAEDTISLADDSEPMELEMKVGVGLRIHVESTSQRPIRDAAVQVGPRNAVTDADGNASVRGLDFDGERLEVNAAGYGPQLVDVATGDDPRAQLVQNVVLEPGALFAGTVVDQNGKPASNAYVQIEQIKYRVHVDADDKGYFEVPLLGPGKVVASAYSDENIKNADETYSHDGLHPRRDVVIHVTTGAQAVGVVVDAAGTPIAKASVQVGTASDQADEHGHFVLKGITPGTVEVSAYNETMAAVTRKVEIRSGAPLELRVEMVASSIAGIVRDTAGQPVDGAKVSADGKDEIGRGHVQTDEHGRFDFGGLPPGEYEVSAKQDKDRAMDPSGVTVPTGTHNLSLTVAELGGIAGRVVENGAPVAYFGIVVSTDPDPSWTKTPDSVRADDGAFVQNDLRPGVYSVALVGAFSRKVIANVRVGDGGITQLGDLAVEPGRIVRGTVRDERGVPIAGAKVAIASRERFLDDETLFGKAAGTQVARTDGAGAFEIAGTGPDTLYIEATHDNDMVAPRELAATETAVALVISRAGALDGAVVNLRGRYARVVLTAADGTEYTDTTDVVGDFHFARVPAGDYKLELTGDTAAMPLEVHINAGATTAVTFDLPAKPIALTVAHPGCKRIRIEAAGSSQGREECNDGVVTFADIAPGTYRACADWEFCSDITVAASPSQQAAVIPTQSPTPIPTIEDPLPERPVVDEPEVTEGI